MANQEKQGQVSQGAENELGLDENNSGQTSNPMNQGMEPQGTDGYARSQLVRNFMTLRPPEFQGGTDALAAEDWMLSIEKHLQTIGCNDAQKVQLVTFLLRGDAKRWWETTKQRFRGREPSWEEFREAFNGTYFLAWICDQKTYEFIELTQENKSVAQYEAKFTSLVRFALDLVSTNEKKATNFQHRLHVKIRYQLAGAQLIDYAIVVQRAYIIAREINELRATHAASRGTSSSHR
ncbi:uncharacterized protein LOC127799783 [Diospyros lotus]|uniref:uncharacterized protein LOC127799783 n=1 Tax=Diospyros lotus TaxID=55363 RepID=UPI00225B9777|nr:uncharacterized protein LOC127799783 [Diospyros lotus]